LAKKREIGLVVPSKYTAMTNDIRFAQVLVGTLIRGGAYSIISPKIQIQLNTSV